VNSLSRAIDQVVFRRKWIKEISSEPAVQTLLTAGISRIALICEIIAPLFFSLLQLWLKEKGTFFQKFLWFDLLFVFFF
jgi:hypothetical protein